jgi:hypothetical protein
MASGQTLAYRIDFENLESATAPAQVVNVSDPLSADLDWATFELTEIGFGDVLIVVPEDQRQSFEAVVPYSFNDVDFEVHVEAGIDADTGEAFAYFYTIDPETELPPSVDIGFLPPEDGTGRGMGHFSFLIQHETGLVSGTEIRNVATIQFDFGLTVATNQVDPLDASQGTDPNKEAMVTIDTGPPTSHVLPLPEVTTTNMFEVAWTGEDDAGGAGVRDYAIYVSTDDGPFEVWLANTSETSGMFTGGDGSTYKFYSVAIDNVGHQEAAPDEADAYTTVSADCDEWYSLTIDVIRGEGDVTVHANGGLVNSEGGMFCQGTELTLIAEPAEGFRFVSWTGVDSSEAETATVVMNADLVVGVEFEGTSPSEECWLTVHVAGGEGTVDVYVMHDDGTIVHDEGPFPCGTVVKLEATPADGYEWTQWHGVDSSDGNTATVTTDGDRTVTAEFRVKASGPRICGAFGPATIGMLGLGLCGLRFARLQSRRGSNSNRGRSGR